MEWLKNLTTITKPPKWNILEQPNAQKGQPISFRINSPEYDHFIATQTLNSGKNLSHGAQHLAYLLEIDPARVEWLALLKRYIDAAGPNIDSLVPQSKEPIHASSAALRACLWHVQGRTADAISHLININQIVVNTRYFDSWVLEWLEPEGAVESLPEQLGLSLFHEKFQHTVEAHESTAKSIRFTRRWAQLLERVAAQYTTDARLIMLRAGLHRRAGDFDTALAIAGPIESARWFIQAVAIGLTHRHMGQYDQADRDFTKALELEPGNMDGYLEAADSSLDGKNWLRALAWYESVLRSEPDHIWALPSSWYCHFKLDSDESRMDQLTEQSQAGNYRARQLLVLEYGCLPESADAGANHLFDVREQWMKGEPGIWADPGTEIKIDNSSLEAPSNRLAMALELAAFGFNPKLTITVKSIPKPDPRNPATTVSYRIWRYEATEPYPALPPPSAKVSMHIATLAAGTFDSAKSWAQASKVAEALGVNRIQEILAVMVHPPMLPPGCHALAWLPRVQMAAAQVLGQIDEGWIESERRKALLSLLHGPGDWATCAAIRVLAKIAIEERAYALDILNAFALQEKYIPQECAWDWPPLLYDAWLTNPLLFDDERKVLMQRRAAVLG